MQKARLKHDYFEHKWVSSSTSVNNQLGMIKNDIENMKTVFNTKINTLKLSQQQAVSDSWDVTVAQDQLIPDISNNVEDLQTEVHENQLSNERRLSQIER